MLQELARQNVDVQFVVTPVNSKWREYTQLSSEMLDEFSTKIDHQITSQGFKVIDLTKKVRNLTICKILSILDGEVGLI